MYTLTIKIDVLIQPSQMGRGCRIQQLHLCRRVRSPTSTNECPNYDTKPSDGYSNFEDLDNKEYLLIAIGPRSTLARSGRTW